MGRLLFGHVDRRIEVCSVVNRHVRQAQPYAIRFFFFGPRAVSTPSLAVTQTLWPRTCQAMSIRTSLHLFLHAANAQEIHTKNVSTVKYKNVGQGAQLPCVSLLVQFMKALTRQPYRP